MGPACCSALDLINLSRAGVKVRKLDDGTNAIFSPAKRPEAGQAGSPGQTASPGTTTTTTTINKGFAKAHAGSLAAWTKPEEQEEEEGGGGGRVPWIS